MNAKLLLTISIACILFAPACRENASPRKNVAVPATVSTIKLAPLALPDAKSFEELSVPNLGYALRVMKGTKVSDGAKGDPGFKLVTPSGYDVWLELKKDDAVAETKKFYNQGPAGQLTLLLDEPDAIIAHRIETGAAGDYCEVTACKMLNGFICASFEGAKVMSRSDVRKLTNDECRALVVTVRSIKLLQQDVR